MLVKTTFLRSRSAKAGVWLLAIALASQSFLAAPATALPILHVASPAPAPQPSHELFSALVQRELGLAGVHSASPQAALAVPQGLVAYRAITSTDGGVTRGALECTGGARTNDQLSVGDSGAFLTFAIACATSTLTVFERNARPQTGRHTWRVAYRKTAIPALFSAVQGVRLRPVRQADPTERARLQALFGQAASRDDLELASCANAFAAYRRSTTSAFHVIFFNRIYHCSVGLPEHLERAVLDHRLLGRGTFADETRGIDPQNATHLTSTATLPTFDGDGGTIAGTQHGWPDQAMPPPVVYHSYAAFTFNSKPNPNQSKNAIVIPQNPNTGGYEFTFPLDGKAAPEMLVEIARSATRDLLPGPTLFDQPVRRGVAQGTPCGADWKQPPGLVTSFLMRPQVVAATGSVTKLDGAPYVGVLRIPIARFTSGLTGDPGYGTTTSLFLRDVRVVPMAADGSTCAGVPSLDVPVRIFDLYPAEQAHYQRVQTDDAAELAVAGPDGTRGAAVDVAVAGYDAPAQWRMTPNAYMVLNQTFDVSSFAGSKDRVNIGPNCAITPEEILNFSQYYQESDWEKVWSSVSDVVSGLFFVAGGAESFVAMIGTYLVSGGQCPLYDPTQPAPANQPSACGPIHVGCEIAVSAALTALGVPPGGLSASALMSDATSYVSSAIADELTPIINAVSSAGANAITTDGLSNALIQAALSQGLNVATTDLIGSGVSKITGNLASQLVDQSVCPDPEAAQIFGAAGGLGLQQQATSAYNAALGSSESAGHSVASSIAAGTAAMNAVWNGAAAHNPALAAELTVYVPGNFTLVTNSVTHAVCPQSGANVATWGAFDQSRNPRGGTLFLNVTVNPSATASQVDPDLVVTDRSGLFEATTVHIPLAAMKRRGQTSMLVPVTLSPFYDATISRVAQSYCGQVLSALSCEGWKQELWMERLDVAGNPALRATDLQVANDPIVSNVAFVVTSTYDWTKRANLAQPAVIPSLVTATLATELTRALADDRPHDEPQSVPLCYPGL